jgi:glycerate kinase
MRFLIAPNAFKGTLTASEAAHLMQEVIAQEIPSATCLMQPLADGGDGTCELLISSLKLEKVSCWSLNAVGQPILGFFGWEAHTQTAYLDVSTCSGIAQLTNYHKNPSLASTYGTGLLIREALAKGAKHLVLGLGGSASIDLGAGILQALGFLFLDQDGRELPAFSPDFLKRCRHIQRPLRLSDISFTCLCDVRNPFFGPMGAVRTFGPQKGLREEEVEAAEISTTDFVDLLLRKSPSPILDKACFGAAGGIAFGLSQFFNCQLEFGAPYFFDRVNLEEKVAQAEWIITGEGQYDRQSEEGKGCFELKQLAHKHSKKIGLISSGKEGLTSGFDAVLELPVLDFSHPDYKKKAREQFHGLFRESISNGLFN